MLIMPDSSAGQQRMPAQQQLNVGFRRDLKDLLFEFKIAVEIDGVEVLFNG